MANASYPVGITAILDGSASWETDDFSVAALTDDYAYSSSHADYSDISDYVIDVAPLDGKEVVDSSLKAATVSPGPVIPLGETVTKLVVFKDALPDEGASTLCFFVDRDIYGMVLYRPGSGAAVPIQWSDSGIYSIPS